MTRDLGAAGTDGGPLPEAGGPPDAGPRKAGAGKGGGAKPGGAANVFSLFDNEEAILDRTEVMLTQLAAVADGVKVLAEAYRRGYREQRRLVRLSDRMQADLQKANKRLGEQQRDLQSLNEALSGEIETSARLEAELRRLADTDPLTGALARRRFLEVCARDWPRRPGQAACLLMLDLDRFKLVNDNHGHAAGDAALVAFVAACRSALRSLDAVGRLGGEEFAVLLVETGPGDGAAVAERIRAAVAARPVATDSGPIGITVSIGLAATGPGESLEAAMRRADAALYAAK
ncbi:GGDEF domain-containing protein, partial [Methylobacterium platani]